MYKIVKKTRLCGNVCEYVVEAPHAARRAQPGQFIILRVDENGERIPLTICDYDAVKGTVTVLVQEVGYSTKLLAQIPEGGRIADFVGPLGNPTDLSEYNNIVLVGGGIGTAVIYPQAKRLQAEGKAADVIVGARTKELIMYEKEFRAAARDLYLTTDDGSYVRKGFVTDVLRERIEAGANYDCVFAVGPMPMMRAVCKLTENYGIKTVVSMNTIMVDGTGMCGGCRLTEDGKIRYACVDGPEFDGHKIDWDEAMNRSRVYRAQEQAHLCRLTGEKR
ncbi:MAG: sulfide/dihydroorotate dehydrogenase-like FAD/NAD-binding protein [Clostridia bacterium]|nr:sulfide/dihydroorotate dehydrogenase-like FAD/NAD-binding protein [Clostridia bacterium]